jgi:signal peptidase I
LTVKSLKSLWRREPFQTLLTYALIFAIVLSFYFGAPLVLGTEYPALTVASTSMLPTLNVGDLIIVQKVDPAYIRADRLTGDILVFRNPRNPEEFIVHRAVKKEKVGSYYLITTLGDYSKYGEKDQFSPWNSSLLIGKVIARIPYIGNLPLLVHAEKDMYILLLTTLAILFILMLVFSFGEGGQEDKKEESMRKADLQIAFFIIINLLIVGFLVFSLFGTFTFPQPGATPQEATIRGMYADLEFHKNYTGAEPFLTLGFLHYKIDLLFAEGVRLGVPTFSWTQVAILAFITFNAWKIIDFVRNIKALKAINLKP